ncbi:GGDEF domain-containing protein [Vibrio japonicus]|uniref:diguanylate cyclase n=1 Tax=Vibrio japonicus TaxID=1824638 RepID=A0ABY5LGC4_9VIBR|nr:GGDEF domain-containing protein [Vibrio japonicus]UUM29873.1 GGDEF domain-containing protein [Vibrio japonicus]
MGSKESDLQSQLEKLQQQLNQVRLTQKDTSFKFTREQKVLKRIIASMTTVYKSEDPRLKASLIELKQAVEQQQDISSLIPKLAILERLLKQQGLAMDKETEHLDSQIKHSGETLLRVSGLPLKIKRDLRELLSYSNGQQMSNIEQAIKLIALYERSVKIIAANPSTPLNEISKNTDRELLVKLSDELQHLITEIDFECESGELLADIRAKLLVGVNTHTLLELTLQTLKLVVEGTHTERKASEQFLNEVNASLSTSVSAAEKNTQQSQSYLDQRHEINEELSGVIGKADAKVKSATHLDTLRNELAPLLDQLNSLSERLHHAESREQALLDRMVHGKNQIEALFTLTQDYRRRLDEQKQRIQLDPLTKVYTRTSFNERLEIEYRRWIKNQHDLHIILFDIDGFGTINDGFGYAAGDKALKIIARTIKNALTDGDTVARFGGEEFILILPKRLNKDCYSLVQSIQQQVSKLPFKFKEQNLKITLSAASSHFKDSDTPEEVLDQLNLRLRKAKSIGPSQFVWN